MNIHLIYKLLKYNLRIVFGNKFVWFLLISFLLFIFITVITFVDNAMLNDGDIYNILMFPGLLLIFYPTVFCIQNDADARSLEIIFGIPDYRFKVWLVRIIMSFLMVTVIMLLFSILSYLILYPINIIEMTYQIMFPIIALGSISFMFASIIKNGYGTSIIIIILGIILWMMAVKFSNSTWYPFLNPLESPDRMNPIVWDSTVFTNRIYLVGFSFFSIFAGLTNLQKREKFI